jgi:iron complex outermembrane receptor protein
MERFCPIAISAVQLGLQRDLSRKRFRRKPRHRERRGLSDAGRGSPISALLTAGLAAYPGAAQFGIRNLTTGQITAASNVAALNALNGNGLLEQTVLNHQYLSTRDFGTDFGAKWNLDGSGWSNSLTFGGMYYRVRQYNDQSGVATLINGVSNSSSIYDVVALNSAGNMIGSLTNNGLESYGNWGQGIWSNTLNSFAEYFNDEMALIDKKLHVDFGLRHEDVNNVLYTGNYFATDPTSPPACRAWSPTWVSPSTARSRAPRPRLFQPPGRWARTTRFFLPIGLCPLRQWQRDQRRQQPDGPYSTEPKRGGCAFRRVWSGWTIDVLPHQFQQPKLSIHSTRRPGRSGQRAGQPSDQRCGRGHNLSPADPGPRRILHPRERDLPATQAGGCDHRGVRQRPDCRERRGAQYDGNYVQRTPQIMYSIQPTYDFPNRWGAAYLRYEYTGKIYTDVGNGLALPGYGVLSVGTNVNFTDRMNLNLNVFNVTNVLGLTEGNPNSGISETVGFTGYFYARGIAGTNATATLSYKF